MEDFNELWDVFKKEIILQWNLTDCLNNFIDFVEKQTGKRIDPNRDGISLAYLDFPLQGDIKLQDIPNFEIKKIVLRSPELTIRFEDIFKRSLESIGKDLPRDQIDFIMQIFTKLYQNSDIDIAITLSKFIEDI